MNARRTFSAEALAAAVRAGDRTMLARAITCVESDTTSDQELARAMMRDILPATGGAFRIGITGVPGAGKSTFIDLFGTQLCARGKKVAVLAIDPSSSRSHGSVLGDKTRMEKLTREPAAFIRPTPASGALGGVARKTRDSMLLCEAAGFDVILVETVGVGQSEVEVRAMTDFLLLLAVTGTGDELQGIKRGIIELADGILVTKADGENETRAHVTRQGYALVLHYLQPATPGWRTWTGVCSALTGAGVSEVWEMLERFHAATTASGVKAERRRQQALAAFETAIEAEWRKRWLADPDLQQCRRALAEKILAGSLDVTSAVAAFMAAWEETGQEQP